MGQILAEGSDVVIETALPPVAYGVIAWAILMALLLVTVMFRNVSNRH